MNILHISDLHFGPYHWKQNDNELLEKINSYPADIVVNTGDFTSDSLETEFSEARNFLRKIKCPHVISIPGNHDKYSKRSHEMFKETIDGSDVVTLRNTKNLKKRKIFIPEKTVFLTNYFTDMNFLKIVTIGSKNILVVCMDSTLFQSDYGFVEEGMLDALSVEMSHISYDSALLLIHHSILCTDNDPLINSKRVVDFVNTHKIEYVFCGHTHELDLRKSVDLYSGHQFTQFMCGSTASKNVSRDRNMFIHYKNLGESDSQLTVIKILPGNGDTLEFTEEII